MPAIIELDALTIGQIAAGEIIDRPASVVKELVENAIDADARRIAVDIERGGLDLIEVTDDGFGIHPDDMPVALRRHTTSKLRSAGELESVATLGFRGEGLASIAAVARIELISRQRSSEVGAHVAAHAESVGVVEPVAAPVGTCVRVAALFQNVPVRREYLRSASAEFNRISSWLSSFALGYPEVTFTLRHDGREIWVMPASDDYRDRLAMVFGRDASRRLLALDGEAARTLRGSVRGFISPPGDDRPDRRMQLLFVNRRMLRSTILSGAWAAGYSTFAMIGRHPYGVLYLDLSPEHVDPNVHPTKSDVRLRYGAQVFEAVRRAIAATLTGQAATRFREHTIAPAGAELSVAPASLFDEKSPAATLPERRLRVLAQLDRTFILAADGEALLLVDQHAAHERIAASPTKRSSRPHAGAHRVSRCSCRTSWNSTRRAAPYSTARSSLSGRAVWRSSPSVSARTASSRRRSATGHGPSISRDSSTT
jgi:DNA mismatch repair protein MutL